VIARTWSLAKGPGELRHTSVSVVLISRNQAWNISRLIESVLDGTGGIQAREIVLVDSASSDGTVEIARRYPIKILRLSPTQPLTPAAGRYVAYERTSGDLILFLDGDMEMCSGWLGKATVIAETEPAVAVVTGRLGVMRHNDADESRHPRRAGHDDAAFDVLEILLKPDDALAGQRTDGAHFSSFVRSISLGTSTFGPHTSFSDNGNPAARSP